METAKQKEGLWLTEGKKERETSKVRHKRGMWSRLKMREQDKFRQENDSFSLIDFKRKERKTESGNRRAR